jgi:hypothetical protein
LTVNRRFYHVRSFKTNNLTNGKLNAKRKAARERQPGRQKRQDGTTRDGMAKDGENQMPAGNGRQQPEIGNLSLGDKA